MPNLKCDVTTCSHNEERLCCLDTIEVGGNNAKNVSETRCNSFKERSEGSYSNSTKSASEHSHVKCQAEECNYNNECKCHADKISVEGSHANRCHETACATFKCQ